MGGTTFCPPADTRRLAAAIPDSTVVTYADTGHLVLWERPERVAADLARFVARFAAGLDAGLGKS